MSSANCLGLGSMVSYHLPPATGLEISAVLVPGEIPSSTKNFYLYPFSAPAELPSLQQLTELHLLAHSVRSCTQFLQVQRDFCWLLWQEMLQIPNPIAENIQWLFIFRSVTATVAAMHPFIPWRVTGQRAGAAMEHAVNASANTRGKELAMFKVSWGELVQWKKNDRLVSCRHTSLQSAAG